MLVIFGLQIKNHEPLGVLIAGTKGCYISKCRNFLGEKQGKSYEI